MKNKMTFADEARAINKRYERRIEQGDEMAKKSRDMELERLKQKQEALRAQLGMSEEGDMPMMAFGGELRKGNNTLLPSGLSSEEFKKLSMKERDQYYKDRAYEQNRGRLASTRAKSEDAPYWTPVREFLSGKPDYGYARTLNIPLVDELQLGRPFMSDAENINAQINMRNRKQGLVEPLTNELKEKAYGGKLRKYPGGGSMLFDPAIYGAADTGYANFFGAPTDPNTQVINPIELQGNNMTKPKSPLLSRNQLGVIGSQLVGTLGQGLATYGASKVKMPEAKPITARNVEPMRNAEEVKALERAYMNRLRESRNLSPGAAVGSMSDAYTKYGQATAQSFENLQNRNRSIEEGNANRLVQTEAQSEQNRLMAEGNVAKRDLDVYGALGTIAGGLGTQTAGAFKDAQDEKMQLVALASMSQPGISTIKFGKGYAKVFSPGGAYRRIELLDGSGRIIYLNGDKEIDANEFTIASLQFGNRAPENIGTIKSTQNQ